jgi:hypothetical protein
MQTQKISEVDERELFLMRNLLNTYYGLRLNSRTCFKVQSVISYILECLVIENDEDQSSFKFVRNSTRLLDLQVTNGAKPLTEVQLHKSINE